MAFEVGRQAGIVLITDEGAVWQLPRSSPNLDVRIDPYLKACSPGIALIRPPSESTSGGAQEQDAPTRNRRVRTLNSETTSIGSQVESV